MSEAEFIFRSEYLPISYHRRRYKDPRLCYKLVEGASFCQHWPVRLQVYESEYTLLGGDRDHYRSSCRCGLALVKIKRLRGTIVLHLLIMHSHWNDLGLMNYDIYAIPKMSHFLTCVTFARAWHYINATFSTKYSPIWACFSVCTSSRRNWARNCC